MDGTKHLTLLRIRAQGKNFVSNFRECRDDSLVKKSMGTRVGRKHVKERPHIQLPTGHIHINIPTCGAFVISSHASESYNHNTH